MFFIPLHKTNSAISPDLTETSGVHVEAKDKMITVQLSTRRDEQYSRERRNLAQRQT